VVAAVGGPRGELERAGQDLAGLLEMKRHLISAMRVEQVVRRRMLEVETDGVERAVLLAGERVQAERDERSEQLRILEDDRLNRAAVVFAVDRYRARRLLALAVRQRRPGTGRHRPVCRRERQPVLAFGAKREVRGVEIRLVEVETEAAIERRPSRVDARGARPAEKVQMVVLGVDARFLFRSVADPEVHTLMIPLGDSNAHRNLVRLIGRRRLRLWHGLIRIARLIRGGRLLWLLIAGLRLDVRELKQLEAVEPPLGVLDDAAPVEIAGLEGQLALNHAIADALVALNLDRAEVRQRPRIRGERERRFFARGVVLLRRDLRVRVAVILQLVQRHLVRGDDQLAVARLTDLQRHLLL